MITKKAKSFNAKFTKLSTAEQSCIVGGGGGVVEDQILQRSVAEDQILS